MKKVLLKHKTPAYLATTKVNVQTLDRDQVEFRAQATGV
jgi:hypothetical protein